MDDKRVLVTGATGNQGRAVIEGLKDTGYRLRALVRNEGDDGARRLKSRGLEVVEGSYDDPSSLTPAVEGVDAVFAVTTPVAGVHLEVQHGEAIADAAQQAGVAHFVYSSVSDADRRTGIPHFDSKFEVEAHLRTLDLPWTITAPAFFFDNVLFPWNAADLATGRFRQALKATIPLKQISVRDIGRFNALVIEHPDRFVGRRINIAGDELTGPDMAAALSTATGRSIAYQEQPLEEVRSQFPDMATMYEWFEHRGFSADVAALRAEFPEVEWLTFAEWARLQDWVKVLA